VGRHEDRPSKKGNPINNIPTLSGLRLVEW